MIDIKNLTFVHLYDKHEGNFPILKIKYDEKELTIDYRHINASMGRIPKKSKHNSFW